jgi:hypothetical protein
LLLRLSERAGTLLALPDSPAAQTERGCDCRAQLEKELKSVAESEMWQPRSATRRKYTGDGALRNLTGTSMRGQPAVAI